jgi:hypothetical protein
MTDTGAPNGQEPAEPPDATPVEPTLADVLDDLADDFPDIERTDGPEGTDFAVGAQLFVRLNGPSAQFRLRPEIVLAAVRTGDAAESALGRDWVVFAPKHFDQYALDRAQSWFELAHRLAAEVARPRPTRRN